MPYPSSASLATRSDAQFLSTLEPTNQSQILAITTDASFHTPEDDPRYYDVGEIIEKCNERNIKVRPVASSSQVSRSDSSKYAGQRSGQGRHVWET